MEKYLKIHWSIRIILGFILFISIFLIAGNIYGGMYYTQIQETLSIVGNNIGERITLSILITSFLIPLLMIITIYYVFNYKHWPIITFFIGIGLPLNIAFLGMIGYMTFGLYSYGFESIQGDEVLFFSIYTSIMIFTWFSIKTNIELIRIYKNIKNIEQIETSKFQDKKPRFFRLFITSMIPLFILGGLMIALDNPVIPLDIPEGYFKIDGFNLDNPSYTDQKICIDFESEIGKMNETVRKINKEDTHSGVILAKEALFSYPSNIQNKFNLNITDEEKQKINLKKTKAINELKAYIQNYPEQWNEALSILRSELTTKSVIQLQNLTHGLPQNTNCQIRNDQNIAKEFSPKLSQYLIASRLYDAAIKLALLENNQELSVELLNSFHEFNIKFYNSNTSLVGGMMGNAILDVEFGSVEYIVENSNPEQLEKIRKIYAVPYNIKGNQINAWKGEYYFFEHVLTGRTKSINQFSIPYLFNGEDMLNRAIILVYAGVIAEGQNDTILLQSIKENKKINTDNFLTPTERSFIGEGISTWRGSNILFAKFYNPIGKMLIESFLPSTTGFVKRYHSTELYQDYIRYTLLGIDKNN